MGLRIPRFAVKTIKSTVGWVLLFGRRKTGKSFMVRNMCQYDSYYFVTRTRAIFHIFDEQFEELDYRVFLERVRRGLLEEGIIVIDEFHRLPSTFLDFLHAYKPRSTAKLILIMSSLRYVSNILGPKSPLLGIVTPIEVGLFDPRELTVVLYGKWSPTQTLLISTLAQDPVVFEDLQLGDSPKVFLGKILGKIRMVVPALIGEIFAEEDFELTERYEAILKALASGNHSPGQVASFISGFFQESLKSQDVKKYINNLVRMGIADRFKIFQKKRYYYQIASPIIDLYYYLDARTGFSEMKVPEKILYTEAQAKLPLYFENYILKALAIVFNGNPEKAPHLGIDGVITTKNEALAIVEIKLGTIHTAEIKKFLKRTANINAPKIIVARNKIEHKKVKVITHEQLLDELYKKGRVLLEREQ